MKTFRKLSISLFAVLLLALGLSTCDPVPWIWWLGAGGGSNVEEEFVRKSIPEQHRLILDYPLDQQVDLYLKSMLEIHPPDLGLADVLASNGADIVPILKDRIIIEIHNDFSKMILVDVFLRMHERGYYSIASDSETMDFLEQQTELMQDALWKKLAVRKIMLIKKEAGLKPDELAK